MLLSDSLSWSSEFTQEEQVEKETESSGVEERGRERQRKGERERDGKLSFRGDTDAFKTVGGAAHCLTLKSVKAWRLRKSAHFKTVED